MLTPPNSSGEDPAPTHAIGDLEGWGIEIDWESNSFSPPPFRLFRLGKFQSVSRPTESKNLHHLHAGTSVAGAFQRGSMADF